MDEVKHCSDCVWYEPCVDYSMYCRYLQRRITARKTPKYCNGFIKRESNMPYRVKHVPTGLYYKPIGGSMSNLSKTGKVYMTESSCLSGSTDYVWIQVDEQSSIFKLVKDVIPLKQTRYNDSMWTCKVPKSEFEKEFL